MDDNSGSAYRVTADELRQFVERFENLEIEKRSIIDQQKEVMACLLYTSPSPRDRQKSRMPSSA